MLVSPGAIRRPVEAPPNWSVRTSMTPAWDQIGLTVTVSTSWPVGTGSPCSSIRPSSRSSAVMRVISFV
jgi:hypothetical protein